MPPESILLPISTHLKHFLNKRQPKLQVWNLHYCKIQQDIRQPAYATGISNALRFEHKEKQHCQICRYYVDFGRASSNSRYGRKKSWPKLSTGLGEPRTRLRSRYRTYNSRFKLQVRGNRRTVPSSDQIMRVSPSSRYWTYRKPFQDPNIELVRALNLNNESQPKLQVIDSMKSSILDFKSQPKLQVLP